MTKAIILAAGQGQRLKPLTNDRPKGMVEVSGQTIIERQLKLFRKLGINDVAVVKGFCAESVPDYQIRHYLNPAYADTNMVYSLFCAEQHLDSGPLIVSYGDILYSENVLLKLLESDAPVSVVVDLHWKEYFSERFGNPYEDAESLVINEKKLITNIGERNPSAENVQAQYIGLIRFNEDGLRAIRQLRDDVATTSRLIGWGRPWPKAFMTDLLQELVNRGTAVAPVPIEGEWCEIDSLRDFDLAEKRIRKFRP